MMKRILKGFIIGFCLTFILMTLIGCEEKKEDRAVVSVVSEKVLIPGGQSVGIKMDVRGVLIVGLEEIECQNGDKVNPGLLSGLQIGDMILEVNGREVYRASDVQREVNKASDKVRLKVDRNNNIMNVSINPVLSADDKTYKLGIWIKDKTAGIGTLTYYDPVDSSFGGLGHGIIDPRTDSILSVESGVLLMAKVQDVEEGSGGNPGELSGVFYHADEPLGQLYRNCEFGIFGKAYHPIENPIYTESLVVGKRDSVKPGKAHIITTLMDNKTERYEIEIEKVNKQEKPQDKSMVIRITDERLLNECGGIVQGMSGSPIIQNNRIVGAVTHVFVNDPTRGYGIFIEWMLDESNFVDN